MEPLFPLVEWDQIPFVSGGSTGTNMITSGSGSTWEATQPVIKLLARAWEADEPGKDLRILDFGCGEAMWTQQGLLPQLGERLAGYHGVDVHPQRLEAARRTALALGKQDRYTFQLLPTGRLDEVVGLPDAGITHVLLKDVLQHYPTRLVLELLDGLRQRFPGAHIYAVNCAHQHTDWQECPAAGDFRPLHDQLFPLRLYPWEVVGAYDTKRVVVWRPEKPEKKEEKPEEQEQEDRSMPLVLLAILVKDKANCLPLFLDCLLAFDYPRSRIALHIRTNDNTDTSEELLGTFVRGHGPQYHSVHYDPSPIDPGVKQLAHHEWTAERFRLLGRLRQESLDAALEKRADYYLVIDVDNFVERSWLRQAVGLNLPIVAPMLPKLDIPGRYANFFARLAADGLLDPSGDGDVPIFERKITGLIQVPLVHCTYLVQASQIPKLRYLDPEATTCTWEFVVFARSAREAQVQQYVDNRGYWGGLLIAGKDFSIPDYITPGLLTKLRQLSLAEGPYFNPYRVRLCHVPSE